MTTFPGNPVYSNNPISAVRRHDRFGAMFAEEIAGTPNDGGFQPGNYPQFNPYAPPPVRPTSSLAVASMIAGIISILGGACLVGIPPLIAVLLGHAAMKETKNGQKPGHGQAVAGLIMGYICLIPVVFFGISMLIGAIAPSGQ
jgi:hypothetical protein